MNAVFSCREAARLASEALDHPLNLRQRMTLRTHTLMCSACTKYAAQISFIDAIFRGRARRGTPHLPSSESLGAAARERIRARLKNPPSTPSA
jgi:hypothetical protein